MGTIADKLSYLMETKNKIKQAITNKGVDVADTDTFRSYADKIDSIEEGGGIDPTWTNWAYFNYDDSRNSLAEKLKFSDTSNGTNFSYMFSGCSNLTTIPQLDTSNGVNFSYMFGNCLNLTTIPQLDTSNGVNFYGMFYNCRNLTTIPQLDTGNGTNFGYTFSGCLNLITITQINTSKGTRFDNMFQNCSALKNLTMIGTINTSGMSLKNSTKLSKASITSVVNALLNTATGKSITLSKTAVNTAFETSAGAADGSTSDEWTALIATKPSWTISLS